MVRLAEEHGTDLAQYRSLLFHGKELSFMSGTTATLSTIVHSKFFCCILEQQCRANFLVSVDFKQVLASSFLNSDRAEKLRRCFSQYPDRSCQDASVVNSD